MSETNAENAPVPQSGKDLAQSRVTLGLVIAALGPLIDPVLSQFGLTLGSLEPIVWGIVSTAGTLIALYGRAKAQEPINKAFGVTIK